MNVDNRLVSAVAVAMVRRAGGSIEITEGEMREALDAKASFALSDRGWIVATASMENAMWTQKHGCPVCGTADALPDGWEDEEEDGNPADELDAPDV